MTDQMTLVKLTDKDRIELGKRAARLSSRLTELRTEFAEVKKDFGERIETTLDALTDTLAVLDEGA